MTTAARRRVRARAAEILAEMLRREVRQAVGLSQADVAARLGIRQPSLSKLEAGEQDMQVEILRRIVEALCGE